MGCRALPALVSAAVSLLPSTTLLFSELFLTYFFSPHFSFSLPFLPFLKYIFPEAPYIQLWVPAVSSVKMVWGQLDPPVSARYSPSPFRGQSCCPSLSTPGPSHPIQSPTCQDSVITSRQHYMQGTDLSALLCMLYCLSV